VTITVNIQMICLHGKRVRVVLKVSQERSISSSKKLKKCPEEAETTIKASDSYCFNLTIGIIHLSILQKKL